MTILGDLKGNKGEEKGTGENSNLAKVQDSLLGPSYNYVAHIQTPNDLGMSANGTLNALGDDVSGILAYIDLLVSGHGEIGVAGKIPLPNGYFVEYKGPLGNKFFLETMVQCKDKETGDDVPRSIYINNVPDGQIPLVSNLDPNISFSAFKGLLPGVLSNLAQINPLQILTAFTTGSSPTCQLVTMETVDVNHFKKYDTAYLTNEDISIMPRDWFPDVGGLRQSDYDLDEDEFCTMQGQMHGQMQDQKKPVKDYSKMPDNILIKIYFSMLGLLGIYILLKMMTKKKK
jgi:hypothetical protein